MTPTRNDPPPVTLWLMRRRRSLTNISHPFPGLAASHQGMAKRARDRAGRNGIPPGHMSRGSRFVDRRRNETN
ncbi:hypothetical protein LY76DRAFT_354308 [Colletotrichum caudatum]|nr:hypothetical protein LY76DRAFT_354308 [Colletotrichum caudatum]